MTQANGSRPCLIGVDVGGTFTDVVVVSGEMRTFKAFSVPGNEAEGVMVALDKAAAVLDVPLGTLLGSTRRFVHGSTVAANALLEKTGARTAFVTTAGFRDTLVMRRMLRENMYDLHARVPESILRREWILEAPERIDRDGNVVRPLADAAVDGLVERIGELDVEAVGISFLFSFRNADHERRLRDAIEAQLPEVYVVASSDVAPEIRDYERASTTALSAYLAPGVAAYLLDLENRLQDAGLTCDLQVMRSNGGVCSVEEAVAQPVDMLLSGPAGGVVAAMNVEGGGADVISFDMGGTSCDISVVRRGRATSSTYLPRHTRFEGWDVLLPFLDIHALGAGGGSIAWLDQANGLHVGPRSAGASPGPACYGRGGTQPTVTDADLALGYLNPDYFLEHEIRLDVDAAERALAAVAGPLGYSVPQLAAGVFSIVNHAMADRIRVVLADSGYDARDFTLLCFGGAGGIHAPAMIAELGIGRVLIPSEASTLSALGLLQSDVRYDFVQTVVRPLHSTDVTDVRSAFERMRDVAERRLARAAGVVANAAPRFEQLADMRYVGQTHELRIPLPEEIHDVSVVGEAYETAYATAYGYVGEPELIQLVNVRLAATGTTAKPSFAAATESPGDGATARTGEREAFFAELDASLPTPVYDGEALAPGTAFAGPAIVELPTTTIVVRPRQGLSVDAYRNYVIEGENT